MINKPLDEITIDDIKQLRENGVAEGKDIEYKLQLNLTSQSEKKEFLKDISSFANTLGGDIIFGLEEESGLIKNINGISITDSDTLLLQMENIVRDGIEPRLIFSPKLILINANNYVLILRIKHSPLKPHRVIYRGPGRFYARNSSGVYSLDTSQLREAFTSAYLKIEKIRKFRLERIQMIKSGDIPLTLYGTAKLILHIIPVNAFEVDEFNISNLSTKKTLKPIKTDSYNNIINFDGIMSIGGNTSHPSYTQLYRNGLIESVNTLLLNAHPNNPYIPGEAFEEALIDSINEYIGILKEIGVVIPILVFLSLTNVHGYKFPLSQQFHSENYTTPIDRDDLILPELQISDYNAEIEKEIYPIFNLIWNACGLKKSIYYDETGRRTKQK